MSVRRYTILYINACVGDVASTVVTMALVMLVIVVMALSKKMCTNKNKCTFLIFIVLTYTITIDFMLHTVIVFYV